MRAIPAILLTLAGVVGTGCQAVELIRIPLMAAEICATAAQLGDALGRAGAGTSKPAKDVREDWRQWLNSQDPVRRAAAAAHLARRPRVPHDVVAFLARMARSDTDPWARRWACAALGRTPENRPLLTIAVRALEAAEGDADCRVREQAARALLGLPPLAHAVRDPGARRGVVVPHRAPPSATARAG